MAGQFKLYINETESELKALLGRQTTARGKERVQALYLLKGGKVKTVSELASLLGRHRVTVQDWLALYRKGGMRALLQQKRPTGRKSSIPPWAVRALKQRLLESQDLDSCRAIQKWLKEQGVNVSYAAVYRLLRKLKKQLKLVQNRRKQLSNKVKRFSTYFDRYILPYWLRLGIDWLHQKLFDPLRIWTISLIESLVGEDLIFMAISVALFSQNIVPFPHLSSKRLAPVPTRRSVRQ